MHYRTLEKALDWAIDFGYMFKAGGFVRNYEDGTIATIRDLTDIEVKEQMRGVPLDPVESNRQRDDVRSEIISNWGFSNKDLNNLISYDTDSQTFDVVVSRMRPVDMQAGIESTAEKFAFPAQVKDETGGGLRVSTPKGDYIFNPSAQGAPLQFFANPDVEQKFHQDAISNNTKEGIISSLVKIIEEELRYYPTARERVIERLEAVR